MSKNLSAKLSAKSNNSPKKKFSIFWKKKITHQEKDFLLQNYQSDL